MTDEQPAPTLADLMAGAGDPTNLQDVVRFWLGTQTWGESFDVLVAGRDVLVSQAGLDAVVELASDQERPLHAAVIQAIAGGFDVDFVRVLVTNREAARDVARQALTNGHDPVVRVVLALNSPLGASDEGAAIFLANALAAGDVEDVLPLCESAAATDAEAAQRVADQLEVLVQEGLAPADGIGAVVDALRMPRL